MGYPEITGENYEELNERMDRYLAEFNDSGVENVTSTSAENYSVIMLEFADDTNMDSAMVKLNTQLDAVKSAVGNAVAVNDQ